MQALQQEKELLQWHPAFFAGIQIELQDEAAEIYMGKYWR